MRKTARPKLSYLVWSICLTLSVIAARLFYLQIHQKTLFFEQSQKNYLRLEKIVSPRGNILDRNGILLVTNRPTHDLYWSGTGHKKLDAYQLKTLELLSSILDTPLDKDEELLKDLTHVERYNKKILLANDIPFDQLSKIEEQFPHDGNVRLETHFKRFYPYNSFACHMLGYLSQFDMESTGKMGLEQIMEETLKGDHGTLMKTINSLGKNLKQVELKKALAGSNIETTLDISLQKISEAVFPEELSGTIIVMDPNDGGLLALVSRPNFDPTIFLNPISSDDWHTLQDKQPFLNRAFNAAYPPGSIFKLVSVSAALEHKITSADAIVDCKGFVTFAGRKYFCARKHGHGELSSCQAVAHSCNILFYEIAKRIDIDLLASYAKTFGLGEKTNSIFSEKTGLVPSRAWKKAAKKERWWPGETLSAAIGQSFLLVTPIQIARMISSIFSGYLTNPRILMNEPIVQEPLDIQPDTRAFLKRSMRAVVKTGTGQNVSTLKDITIYAKTSTAQTSALYKRDLGKKYLEHGWFVAHVTYKNFKPITLVVLVENIGSASVATQIAKNFLIEYKKIHEEQVPDPEIPVVI